MFHALRYHRRGTACVIPIILRPCDWQNAPFARLECLPLDGKAVTEWSDHDAALSDIARDLRQVLDACTWTPQRSSTAKRACLACFLLCSLLANAAQLRFHSHGKWFNLVLFGVIGMLFKICSVNGCVYNTSLFLSRSSYCLKGFDSY